MSTYEVFNAQSGLIFGLFEGETPEAAIDAMARDAGYADQAEAAKICRTPDGEIVARLIEVAP